MNTRTIKALAISGVLALAACGGGGGGGGGGGTTPLPVASAEGLWNGSTSSSRSVTAIVLDNGSYWFLYSLPRVNAVVAGFIQGSGSALNGSFSSSDGVDFNLEGQGINNATLAASYVARQSFNGTVSYTSANPPFTFTSAYNTDYDKAPSLSAIAGSYAGIASVAGGTEAASIAISAQGVIAGTGLTASGCQFVGAAVPRAKGNLYDLSVVVSGGGACASATGAVTGIAYFDAGSKRLYLAALNKSRSNGLSFVGLKP